MLTTNINIVINGLATCNAYLFSIYYYRRHYDHHCDTRNHRCHSE